MRGRSRLAYGLNERVANAFGEEDDEEDDLDDPKKAEAARVATLLAREQKAQAEVAKHVEEVVQEDPTAFQYDEVYDDMKRGTKKAKVEEKKPKYVDAILAHAKEREKEREILMEKKIAREIEQEAEVYGDVEKFVTAGYKRKLEERQAWIEEEKAKEAEEVRAKHAPIDHQRRTTLFTGKGALPAEVSGDDTSVQLAKDQPSPRQIPQNLPEKKKGSRSTIASSWGFRYKVQGEGSFPCGPYPGRRK
eukprot:CAMPEP_0183825204 /NCGR_PEP_ID=MMETSP0807_2-20130328/1002_1 /TAXON_ID=88271 /ORGANISM="Picocystis salinarum, Strain CCMP1897" /LENGTH=247 /DNA_ID=CAMNT_0026070175 /DNA_START=12 /DNA_END=755 /DNA_ORIENTATION=+